ncbi:MULTISPECIES: hypothetical protein [unclassified Ensifer]|uniref:hypothetical protein n=1 Tax=unclassified Ensifer TaxID=2633371 RepID=UPI000813A765|nr:MULTISPECIES: hypothetical protein [unclassified Ensifer]OCP17468.1 hypothetical protein BC361_08415 [Ensifer sp. LC54]OCP28626.1 hypothetical protein BC363_01940 [Ensifer sp. LC384]
MSEDTAFVEAENSILRFLLLEISEALVARGALTRDDIAGALLRTEWGAEVLDDEAEASGPITHPHAGLARLTTEQWSTRFGIAPSLFALRKLHTDWLTGGQKGPAPLYPRQVIEWSRVDDEGGE